jgi:hypothetical protein
MAAHSFTLAANSRGSHEQSNTRGFGFPLERDERLELESVRSDLNSSINRLASAFLFSVDFKENADLATTDFAISPSTSTSTFSAKSQSIVAWMSEHGIGVPRDIVAAARLRELSSDLLGTGAAEYGWCLRTGMGVPLDFTLDAEFFQSAAYAGDRNGENSFGACLERGEGIEPDIQRALFYYRRAAAGLDSDGMYNLGRCLEYGKGIERNTERAAKFYRRRQNWVTRRPKTVSESSSSVGLASNPISASLRTFTSGQQNAAIPMGQTISGSVWSTAAALPEIPAWPPNITNSPPITTTPRRTQITAAAAVCSANGIRPTDRQTSLPVGPRAMPWQRHSSPAWKSPPSSTPSVPI